MAITFKSPRPETAAETGAALKQRRLPAWVGSAACPLVALIVLLCTEWIHRGVLDGKFWTKNFIPHFSSYLLAWLFVMAIYYLVYGLTRLAPLAAAFSGVLCCVPATVTYFKLTLRGEPFLPWDIYQAGEAMQVVGQAGIEIQPSMVGSIVILVLITVALCFVRRPAWNVKKRIAAILLPAAGTLLMVFGIYLQPAATRAFGIVPDMWLQDRYYRNNGVVTGFMSNLQMLKIAAPQGYSEKEIQKITQEIAKDENPAPHFDNSYAAAGDGKVKQPNIIYVMDESYWDASRLEGVEYSEDISANIHRLEQECASGRAYSPSFGGGTCDVEFEALTGYSKEFLPFGSKPYQQHINREMFSLPNFLKDQGYQTAAVHGYYKRFWNRDKAYPRLGLDQFIGLDDMNNPEKKRDFEWRGGLVTDDAMADEIIRMFEERDPNKPMFLHAVTMQNHTNYHPENYPDDERVRVVKAPEGMDEKTIGALEDFATGVRDADRMMARLTEYFDQQDEPVILVFWGDHYNPIGSSYKVYTSTGYASDNSNDPELHRMDLLIWSNYWKEPVDFGTIGAYEIAPMVMDLYGLDQPLLFRYLNQQLDVYRSRTLGVTMQPDDTAVTQEVSDMTPEQQQWFRNHWMLQYDLMFGREYLLKQEKSAQQ